MPPRSSGRNSEIFESTSRGISHLSCALAQASGQGGFCKTQGGREGRHLVAWRVQCAWSIVIHWATARLSNRHFVATFVYNRFMLARILTEASRFRVGSLEVGQPADAIPPAVESAAVCPLWSVSSCLSDQTGTLKFLSNPVQWRLARQSLEFESFCKTFSNPLASPEIDRLDDKRALRCV